ncbi:MAG: hypothetical protein ACREUG_12805 [Steroidobacteraceae bacterium]
MKAFTSILLLTAALACGQAFADCSYPKPPDKIPDGATATKQEMISGMMAVRTFDHAIKAYTDCLRLEHDSAVSKIDPKTDSDKAKAQKAELDSVWTKKNDAAVDEDSSVASRFNDQVKIFNARSQKNKS